MKDCFPNPALDQTTFSFKINANSEVTLKLYNSQGKMVREIINTSYVAGDYEISFALEGLTPGVYIYKIEAGNFIASKKLIIVK